MAFNAKNLQYDKNEPAFLRRLKGEFGGLDGRHNVQIARPKKDRLKTGDDDEDDPVIVDEHGESVDKAEFERRMKGDDNVAEASSDKQEASQEAGEKSEGAHADRQKVAEIGTSAGLSKKRKAVKVVGAVMEDEEADADSKKAAEDDEIEDMAVKKKIPGPNKKKGKKIKLSFDDPEG